MSDGCAGSPIDAGLHFQVLPSGAGFWLGMVTASPALNRWSGLGGLFGT